MEITKPNVETAKEIINIFIRKNYTVDAACDVLRYVSNALPTTSTVQRQPEVILNAERALTS